MLIPTKYEKLNHNIMVLGASVINLLRKKSYTVEELHQILQKEEQVNLERFYNILSFLWIADIIDSDNFSVYLKKQNVPQ